MKIKEVIVRNRVRKNIGDLEPLMSSMEKYGLISPIIVNPKNVLIAGERRLEAAKKLGWTEIDVIVKDLDTYEAIDLELEENTTRKEFEIQELTQGMKKQYKLSHNIFYKIIYVLKHYFVSLFRKK